MVMKKFSKELINQWIEKKYNEIEELRSDPTLTIKAFCGYSNQLYTLDELINFIDDETYE